jgi:hypothetical protein
VQQSTGTFGNHETGQEEVLLLLLLLLLLLTLFVLPSTLLYRSTSKLMTGAAF